MLAFSAVLLYFVLFHSVTHDVTGLADNGELMLASDHNEPGVYCVNVSATRLILIASWSSSLAPLLVTSMATLWFIEFHVRWHNNPGLAHMADSPRLSSSV